MTLVIAWFRFSSVICRLVNERHLPPVQPFDGARGLSWTQIAAIAESGDKVAFARIFQLGVMAGNRAEASESSSANARYRTARRQFPRLAMRSA